MVGDQACVSVVIEDDIAVDGDKQFQLIIQTSSIYGIDQPSTTNVTIVDDDSKFHCTMKATFCHERECYILAIVIATFTDSSSRMVKIPIPDFQHV